MKNIIRIIFCAIIVDLFFFSSVFTFTRGINSKLILGVLGLVVFVYKGIRSGGMNVSRQMVVLTLLAAGVSLASYLSMVYNNTNDGAYLSYVVSMLVWLSAAYMVIVSIKALYGEVSFILVADFIIAVSFAQCAFAILGNMYTPFNDFIKMIVPGTTWLDSVDRIYGIGESTALDTGGIRYSIACILCAYMLVNSGESRRRVIPWYVLAYVFITIAGNMIARTTTVGAIIALIYLFIHTDISSSVSYSRLRVFIWLIFIIVAMTGISIWLYNTNEIIHKNLRFAFEGFFSLVETGEWNVSSNNKLISMYVWPDNPRTWIIGDGYFSNPYMDPNYMGEITDGYYMNTDVGYLRFIYYFGLVGLSIFSIMILYAGNMCRQRYREYTLLFIALIVMHFIIWFKVATDCFFILAIFIAMAYVRDFSPEPVKPKILK